jgi:hypothetical protein
MLILTEASTWYQWQITLQMVHYNNPRTHTTYRRPLSVLSKLSIQPGRRIANKPAPTLTKCVGSIRLPRVVGVPNGSALETSFSQFFPTCILSSSELQSIPLIASLSTAAIAAALPHEKQPSAGKPKSAAPHAIQFKSYHVAVSKCRGSGFYASTNESYCFCNTDNFSSLTTLPFFQSKWTPYIFSYSVNPTIIM